MDEKLIEVLSTLGNPVYKQGSLTDKTTYPKEFFTFWCFSADTKSYSNGETFGVWSYWIYFYSNDPETIHLKMAQAKKQLQQNQFIVNGMPIDAASDVETHTGKMFETYYIQTLQEG